MVAGRVDGHRLAELEIVDVGAELDNGANKLMAEGDRQTDSGKVIGDPVLRGKNGSAEVLANVGSTDATVGDVQSDLVRSTFPIG